MHTHTPGGARTRLVVLNIVLLVLLSLVTLSSRAGAQGGADRARGNYTMVSGRTQGSTTHTVYILDQANQELIALAWDRTRDRLMPIGYRSLTGDSKTQRGAR